MKTSIKPKEATEIINSLLGGTVPRTGVQHIAVGRDEEIAAMVEAMEDVKNGHNHMKFWIGDFGSGKSFMFHLLKTIALKQKFVVASADFTPDNRLYSNDGKGGALFSALMDNISIQTRPDGGALQTLLEKWIDQMIVRTAQQHSIPLTEIRSAQYLPLIQDTIFQTINTITETGGFEFGTVVMKYYEGYINEDESLRRNALKWLKGEYKTKTEARQDLGVREIINDLNFYDMLKNFTKLFVSIGYAGFMINLDEAINLYKISTSTMREKNYEKLLTIYNDCYQGKVGHMFINVAGTREFLENERRGLYSYHALKTRLETNKYAVDGIKDFAQPVIRLLPINHNEIFVLLKNLKHIFDQHYKVDMPVNEEDIAAFMEDIYNKPGAEEFLMPREVIREFLHILSVLRQNSHITLAQLVGEVQIKDERPGSMELLDSIQEL
ncbi:MAG: ATP-binding protein [Tannerellaceae bacterium]|nr:ATP-binding protein [Tannerellaceae bacterium]